MQWRGVSILQEKWCRASWASAETARPAASGASPVWLPPERPTRPPPLSARISPTLYWLLRGSQGGESEEDGEEHGGGA